MFRSGCSGASQRWVGVNRPGSDTGADTPPPLVGWVPRPAFDAALGSGPSASLADLRRWHKNNLRASSSGSVGCSYIRLVAGSSPIAVPLPAPRSTAPPQSPTPFTRLPLAGQEKVHVSYVGRERIHEGVTLAEDRHVEQRSVWSPDVGKQPPIGIAHLHV